MNEFYLQLDYYGLLNLHKALLEAKFNLNPDNELVSGSPLIADIYISQRTIVGKRQIRAMERMVSIKKQT